MIEVYVEGYQLIQRFSRFVQLYEFPVMGL